MKMVQLKDGFYVQKRKVTLSKDKNRIYVVITPNGVIVRNLLFIEISYVLKCFRNM